MAGFSEIFSSSTHLDRNARFGRTFREISPSTVQWKRGCRFYEGLANFLSSLPTGHEEGNFTMVSENFSSHFATEELNTVLTKISEIFFSTTHRTSDCGFGEILKFFPHYPMEVNCGFEQRIGKLSSHFPLRMRLPFWENLEYFSFTYMGEMSPCTTHWRSDSGLAESFENFFFSLSTGH